MEYPAEFNVNFKVIPRDSGCGFSNYGISLHFEDHFSQPCFAFATATFNLELIKYIVYSGRSSRIYYN